MAIAAQVLIDAIARLKNTVEPAEMAVLLRQAQNPESSMDKDRLAAAKILFEETIRPHYAAQFNAVGGVDAIFAKIKEMILEEVVSSSQEPTKTWVKNNKAILIDEKHAQYQRVLAESRTYFTSFTDHNQIAWRNFDPGAPMFAGYGSNFFVGDNAHAEAREILVYYYLAITDVKAVPDPEEQKRLKANFIGKLSEIRRKNIDVFGRAKDSDIPSCLPGTRGRLADMGQGHPIAQLWFTIEEALPPYVTAKAVEKLKKIFLDCKINKERKGFLDNLQKPLAGFSETDLALRHEILKKLDIEYSGAAYQLRGDWVWGIEGKLPPGKVLWDIHKKKILLMLLDPMSYFSNEILKVFNSLEPIEENLYQGKAGAPFFEHYKNYLRHEREEAAKQVELMEKADFLERFSPEKIKERMINVSIDAGFHGGDREEIIKAIAREETINLLQDYTKKFIESKNKAGAIFDYLTCRKQAITALLAEGTDFSFLPVEVQEARIRILDVKIKELQAIPKQQYPKSYQQLDPEYPLNIATVAHEAFEVVHERSVREDAQRFIQNVINTGPTGENSGPYGATMALPRMPVVHPYHPNVENLQTRHGDGVPAFIMAVAFSIETRNHLPAGIRALLQQHGVSIENLEIFFCAQDMPWKDVPLLLRPHPWLHQDAPTEGQYKRENTILAGVSDIYGYTTPLAPAGISTHGEGNLVVYSPENLVIQGVQDYKNSHAFYSFCIDTTTKKAALTLHWLLNDQDFERVKEFYTTLAEYIVSLKAHFQNTDLLAALEALLGDKPPVPRQGAKRYYLQEQASLSSQVLADVQPSELEYIENSMRSLPSKENVFNLNQKIGYLSLLETEHARLSAAPAGKKKRKEKEKEQISVPIYQVPQVPQEQAGPSMAPLVFSQQAVVIGSPIVAQTPQSTDDRILAELVREAEGLRAQGQPVYYVYADDTITITEQQPKGFLSGSFDLSAAQSGQNQIVFYKASDLTNLYGHHGFVHRISRGATKPPSEKTIASYKGTYAKAPRTLQEARQQLACTT